MERICLLRLAVLFAVAFAATARAEPVEAAGLSAAQTGSGRTDAGDSPKLPPRQAHRLFVAGEFGWNALAGVGVDVGYHLLPHLTVEAGGGFSLLKWKLGARVRANLWEGAWTPFAAAGIQYGFGDAATEATFSISGNALKYRLSGAPFAQVVAGLDYTDDEGVVFLATLGWAFRLANNLQLTQGTPNDQQQTLLGLSFGSGPVVAAAIGYSF
jgi:hypothetical protein